jgi:hypothetical protein
MRSGVCINWEAFVLLILGDEVLLSDLKGTKALMKPGQNLVELSGSQKNL